MNDEELEQSLAEIGVTSETVRALLLLPLVQVAWTDGEIQPKERETVLELARTAGLDAPGTALVERWMARRPRASSFVRARTVLVELARRGGIDAQELSDTVKSCETVAAAAGGLFGLAMTISAAERDVIADIASALAVGPSLELDAPEPPEHQRDP